MTIAPCQRIVFAHSVMRFFGRGNREEQGSISCLREEEGQSWRRAILRDCRSLSVKTVVTACGERISE